MARGGNRRRVESSSEAVAPPGRARKLGLAVAGVALASGLAVGAIHGWRAMAGAEAFRIREIRFDGLQHATSDELLALSPVKAGDHLLLADVAAIPAAMERHPWVRAATIRRSWPPAIVVSVRERTAAALVDLGGLYLVDEDASVFKRAAAGDGLDLPVITGVGRGDYVQRRTAVEPLLRGALALVRAWRVGGRDAQAKLSEIHVDPGEGTTLYVGEEGTQVRLGSGDLTAKLTRLETMLSTLRAEGKKAEVLHLDNRVHPSWVTVRLASSDVVKGGGR